MTIIYVTGTPGVGKTTFTKNLELALNDNDFQNYEYRILKHCFYDNFTNENNEIEDESIQNGENNEEKIDLKNISKMIKDMFDFQSIENIDLTDFIKNNFISDEYDEENDCMIVDLGKLKNELLKYIDNENNDENDNSNKEIEKLYIIDSHMTPNLDIIPNFQIVIKKDINLLRKDLEKRKYSKSKIDDNIECEVFDVNLIDSLENYPNIKTIELIIND